MKFISKILLVLLQLHLNSADPCKLTTDDPKLLSDPSCDQDKFCQDRNTYFNPEIKKCILQIFNSETRREQPRCDRNTIQFTCPENAYCDWWGCRCNRQFLASLDDKKCEKARSHLEDCNISGEVSEKCAEKAGLSCQDGKCHCESNSFWNNESSICVKNNCEDRNPNAFQDPESGECKLKLTARNANSYRTYGLSSLKDNLISCPKNSSIHGNSESGNCRCDENFQESENRQRCLVLRTHGEECGSEEHGVCNEEIGFFCQDGICKCRGSGIYNPTDSLCYSEEDCKRRNWETFFDSNAGLPECRRLIGSRCEPDADSSACPTNSACAEFHYRTTCECNEDFTSSDDRKTCIEIKNYGEECTKEEGNPCSPNAGLSCLGNGTCGCQDNQVWSSVSQKCGLKESERCEETASCSRNANCEYSSYIGRSYCKCAEGYSAKNDQCFGHHLSKCEFDVDCHDGTLCIDGLCRCADLLHDIYDDNLKRCVRLAGSPCSLSSDDFCTRGSGCSEGVCKCEPGFHTTPKGSCAKLLNHGENCTVGQCDFTKGFACVSGTCDCVDRLMTLDSKNGCVVKVGEECGLIEPVQKCGGDSDKQCDSYMVNCETSAYCQHIGKGVSRCELLSAPSIPHPD